MRRAGLERTVEGTTQLGDRPLVVRHGGGEHAGRTTGKRPQQRSLGRCGDRQIEEEEGKADEEE